MNEPPRRKRDEYALHSEIEDEAKRDAEECGLGDHCILAQMRWEEIVYSRELKQIAQRDHRTRYRRV